MKIIFNSENCFIIAPSKSSTWRKKRKMNESTEISWGSFFVNTTKYNSQCSSFYFEITAWYWDTSTSNGWMGSCWLICHQMIPHLVGKTESPSVNVNVNHWFWGIIDSAPSIHVILNHSFGLVLFWMYYKMNKLRFKGIWQVKEPKNLFKWNENCILRQTL